MGRKKNKKHNKKRNHNVIDIRVRIDKKEQMVYWDYYVDRNRVSLEELGLAMLYLVKSIEELSGEEEQKQVFVRYRQD